MSGFIKPAGWGGSYRDDFADKLGILGLGYCLDEEREYDIYVGEGGQESAFFHHYIVIDSPDLPDNNRRIVFELAKGFEANPSGALVPGVRLYSSGGLKYRITVKTTLRYPCTVILNFRYYHPVMHLSKFCPSSPHAGKREARPGAD